MTRIWHHNTAPQGFPNIDVGYRKSDKSLFRYRYNVRLCALQSNIGRSDIRLSPISLITDIGLSAHLYYQLMMALGSYCVSLHTLWAGGTRTCSTPPRSLTQLKRNSAKSPDMWWVEYSKIFDSRDQPNSHCIKCIKIMEVMYKNTSHVFKIH